MIFIGHCVSSSAQTNFLRSSNLIIISTLLLQTQSDKSETVTISAGVRILCQWLQSLKYETIKNYVVTPTANSTTLLEATIQHLNAIPCDWEYRELFDELIFFVVYKYVVSCLIQILKMIKSMIQWSWNMIWRQYGGIFLTTLPE